MRRFAWLLVLGSAAAWVPVPGGRTPAACRAQSSRSPPVVATTLQTLFALDSLTKLDGSETLDRLAHLKVTPANRLQDATSVVFATTILLPALCVLKIVCLSTVPVDMVHNALRRRRIRSARRRAGVCTRTARLGT